MDYKSPEQTALSNLHIECLFMTCNMKCRAPKFTNYTTYVELLGELLKAGLVCVSVTSEAEFGVGGGG